MKRTFAGAIAAMITATFVAVGAAAPAQASVSVVAPILTLGSLSEDANSMVAVSNDGSLVAASTEYGGVTLYDVATDVTTNIPISQFNSTDLGGAAFSADNSFLFVADYDNDLIIVIDLADNSTDRTISLGVSPWALVASQDGAYLYAHTYSTGDVYKIDLSNDNVSGPVDDGGTYTWGMCISADGATLYSPTYEANGIAVIDTGSMTVTDTWSAPSNSDPYSCTMDNDGNLIVAGYTSETVIKFAADGSYSESSAFAVSGTSSMQGAAASCDTVYVAENTLNGEVQAYDLATLDAFDPLPVPEDPNGYGFYGYSAARSLDGAVVAIGGYYNPDGLAIIKTPECAAAPSPDPELPNTGANMVGFASLGLTLLVAGAIALAAVRRRHA